MGDDTGVRAGVRRGVHALVQTLGATAVELRLPAPPVAGDSGEELGMRAPLFQSKPLEPVAVRRTQAGVELLVAADTLEATLGVDSPGAVSAAVEAVDSVQVGDLVYLPAATETVPCRGGVCLYRIALRPQNAEAA